MSDLHDWPDEALHQYLVTVSLNHPKSIPALQILIDRRKERLEKEARERAEDLRLSERQHRERQLWTCVSAFVSICGAIGSAWGFLANKNLPIQRLEERLRIVEQRVPEANIKAPEVPAAPLPALASPSPAPAAPVLAPARAPVAAEKD